MSRRPGFDGWNRGGLRGDHRPADPHRRWSAPRPSRPSTRPGCGDVFGAACAARLLAGVPVADAIRDANALAARNAAYRGAGGLVRHLRGELVAP